MIALFQSFGLPELGILLLILLITGVIPAAIAVVVVMLVKKTPKGGKAKGQVASDYPPAQYWQQGCYQQPYPAQYPPTHPQDPPVDEDMAT